MTWETPAALWLGLTVPAILLLWILRPRRPRLRVSSLLLWPGSPAERQSAQPWQRLRNHPLLWLQILAALLLALAAARPFLPASAAAQHLVVFLDASGSMRARDVAPDRFAAAVTLVLDLARGLGPGQQMTLIRLDEQPRLLVANAGSVSQVEAALADQEPTYGPADVAAALALAAGVIEGPSEWVVVSDGGLEVPADARRPAGTSFRFLSVGNQEGNVALTGLSSRQAEGSDSLQAGLRNLGASQVAGSVQLFAEGQLVAAQDWQLAPGGQTYLTWAHLPTGPRWYEARLTGLDASANILPHDDQAWVVMATPGEPSALLVSAGNSFLERVLSIYGRLQAFRVAPEDWPGLAAQGSTYPLTVLDRLPSEPPPRGNVLLVGPPVGEEFRPRQIWPRVDHPLLRHVDWSDVRVASARQVPLEPGWETIVDSDGGPLLVVREEGGRRQAMLTFALGQSDLPLRPAFPVLLANLLEWLLAQPVGTPRSVPPGTAITIDSSPLAQQVWVEATDGDRYDLAPPWPPQPFRPPAPGLYRVVQAGEGLQQEFAVVADGYHAREASVAPQRVDLPMADDEQVAPARSAISFWPWLAAAILLISVAEWWLDARGR